LIKDAPEGGCFAFRRRNHTFVAIKLTNGQTMAVLWPCHPNGGPAVPSGLFDNSMLGQDLVWLLADAKVIPDSTAAEIRGTRESSQAPGSLVFANDTAFVITVPGDGSPIALVNLTTGDLMREWPKNAICFQKWSISVTDVDGNYVAFCTIPDPDAAALTIPR
jgi:hypothetical protein